MMQKSFSPLPTLLISCNCTLHSTSHAYMKQLCGWMHTSLQPFVSKFWWITGTLYVCMKKVSDCQGNMMFQKFGCFEQHLGTLLLGTLSFDTSKKVQIFFKTLGPNHRLNIKAGSREIMNAWILDTCGLPFYSSFLPIFGILL